MKHHKLKLISRYFKDVVDGNKKSEVRFNDRGYQVGDVVTLQEGDLDNGEFVYTGRTISAKISFIDNYALSDGFLNLSLSDVGLLICEDSYET